MSIVRFVRRGYRLMQQEVYLTQLANFNLAGNFNSHVNQVEKIKAIPMELVAHGQ